MKTLDADLSLDDATLHKTYLGTDNYLTGSPFSEYIKKGEQLTIQLDAGGKNGLADNWSPPIVG